MSATTDAHGQRPVGMAELVVITTTAIRQLSLVGDVERDIGELPGPTFTRPRTATVRVAPLRGRPKLSPPSRIVPTAPFSF